MQTIIEAIREILGSTADFYVQQSGYSSYWDYGAMLEYAFAGIILIIVVGSVFKILRSLFER